MYRSILITGGTGFLGSELTHQVHNNKEAPRNLVCLVRDSVPKSRFFSEGLDKKIITVQGDIRNQELLERIIVDYEIDLIYHLAAQPIVWKANAHPADTLDINIRGTWSLLEAARRHKVKSVIIASSDKAYGNLQGEKYDESFPLQGEYPYDVSKSCADLIARSYGISYGMNVAITRCGNFFGPGDLNEDRIIPTTILAFLKGERPVIRSDGHYIRDYIYVADAAEAYRTLAKHMAEHSLHGEAFNFSYGLRLSVLEVVDRVKKIIGTDIEPEVLNQATNEIPVQCLDSSKAKEQLRWQPKHGFNRGIEQTIGWYRDCYFGKLK